MFCVPVTLGRNVDADGRRSAKVCVSDPRSACPLLCDRTRTTSLRAPDNKTGTFGETVFQGGYTLVAFSSSCFSLHVVLYV